MTSVTSVTSVVASSGQGGNSMANSYLLQLDDYEAERGYIIQEVINKGIDNNFQKDFPYSIDSQPDSFNYNQNIFGMEKLTPMLAPEESLGRSRTKAENDSTISSGIAYQCNVNEKSGRPFGYKSSGTIRDDIRRDDKFKFPVDWEVEPYKFNDTWQNRSDWRRTYSWMTGLPLWFDTRVKPQCEHKIPLFQQVYQIMGPISVTTMRASTTSSSKSFKKMWYGKLMGSLDKLMVELATKLNKNIKDKNSIRNNFKIALRNKIIRQIRNRNIKVGYGSDDETVQTSSSIGRNVTNRTAQEPNFIINKYLIRQECYAWEYAYTNMWAKSQEMFIKLSISEDNVLSFDINEDVIKQCVNTLSWCILANAGDDKTKLTYTDFHYDLCDTWAEIAFNIIKLNFNFNKKAASAVTDKIREHMKEKYDEVKNTPDYNFPADKQGKVQHLIATDVMNWYKLYPDEGVLSLINACLGGKEIIDLGLLDRRCKDEDGTTPIQYSRAYIYANMCNQMILLKHLLNYSINEGTYKICDDGDDADQGIRNMLRLNYLRLKRMVKKNPDVYDMDRFKAQPLFIALRDINSVDARKKSDAEDYFRDQKFVNIQAGGGQRYKPAPINDPFMNETGDFLDAFFEWGEGHEGEPKEGFQAEIVAKHIVDIDKVAMMKDVMEEKAADKAAKKLAAQKLKEEESSEEESGGEESSEEEDEKMKVEITEEEEKELKEEEERFNEEIKKDIDSNPLLKEDFLDDSEDEDDERAESPPPNPYTELEESQWKLLGKLFKEYLGEKITTGDAQSPSQDEEMDEYAKIAPLDQLRDDLFVRIDKKGNGQKSYVNNASDMKLYRILANRLELVQTYGAAKPVRHDLPNHVLERRQWKQFRIGFNVTYPHDENLSIEDRLEEFGMTESEPKLIDNMSNYIKKTFQGKKIDDKDIIRYILDPPPLDEDWNKGKSLIRLSRDFDEFLKGSEEGIELKGAIKAGKRTEHITDSVEQNRYSFSNKKKEGLMTGLEGAVGQGKFGPRNVSFDESEEAQKARESREEKQRDIDKMEVEKTEEAVEKTEEEWSAEFAKRAAEREEEKRKKAWEKMNYTCGICQAKIPYNQPDRYKCPECGYNPRDGSKTGGRKRKKKRTQKRRRRKKKTRKSKRKKKRTKKKRRRRKKRTRRRR